MNYILRHDNLEIAVNSKGAELVNIIYQGRDYMRVRDEYWSKKSPILFPIIGKLKNHKTSINGELCYIPPHGFIKDMEFELFRRTKNQLIFSVSDDENTLRMYPYRFVLFVGFKIIGKSLHISLNIVNKNKVNMPFNIGGHPGFKVPLFENESFEDYSVVFEREENFNAPSVCIDGTLNFDKTTKFENINKIDLDYKYFDVDAIVIPRVKSKYVSLINKQGKGIKFSYHKFTSLALWTRPNAPFLCLEPWRGYADKHNSNNDFLTKDNLITLRREESYTLQYSIEILD